MLRVILVTILCACSFDLVYAQDQNLQSMEKNSLELTIEEFFRTNSILTILDIQHEEISQNEKWDELPSIVDELGIDIKILGKFKSPYPSKYDLILVRNDEGGHCLHFHMYSIRDALILGRALVYKECWLENEYSKKVSKFNTDSTFTTYYKSVKSESPETSSSEITKMKKKGNFIIKANGDIIEISNEDSSLKKD